MRLPLFVVLLLAAAGCADNPAGKPSSTAVPPHAMADPARGELLYRTACQGCHDRDTHWRNLHQVRDWATLVEQVTRWEKVADQTWTMDEVEDVSAYLNRQFYDVPCPLPRCKAGTVGEAPNTGAGMRFARRFP